MTALPPWATALRHTDRLKLLARLEMFPDPEEQQKTWESWKERVEDPAYLIREAVRTGSALQPKDIVLPAVSTEDDGPLEGVLWDSRESGYANRGELYAHLQADRVREWETTVREFEAMPNDFYNAWQYLDAHPAFWRFRPDDGMTPPEERITEWNLCAEYGVHEAVDIRVTKVHHATGWQEEGYENAVTEVWIELGRTNWPGPPEEGDYICKGEIYPRDYSCHDYPLDCGGATMESAIIAAAVNVHTHYGNDRRICDKDTGSVSADG